uniref:Protein Ycf2 n=1 Tax=Libocedrus chevalieri TaxID=2250722 RepID=A0A8F5J7X9_9CONI|nr:hypothetical protein RF2 [Libocedrus chevalieri]
MQKDKNPCPTDPIRKNQEIAWFFSVQSKFKDFMMEIFVPWNESNLVRLLSQIFSGRESVVKLFDFRILSTLLIRDIRIFILKDQEKRAAIVIALPLLFYFLNTRTFIDERQKSYNLIKIFPPVQDFVARASKKNVLLVPHLFMSLPKDKRRYQRCLLNPKEHFWLSSSNTNLNLQNFNLFSVLESEKQETISEKSPLENESNGIEWKIDSSFDSIQNECWEPEKEPENLYEWYESVFYRKKILEELENNVEQLEKKLVEAEEQIALSSQPEEMKIKQREKKVQDIENAKELFRKVTKQFQEFEGLLEKPEQEKMIQEGSDQAREYFSFSESKLFQGLSDHLSIEELEFSINFNNKPSEKFKLLKGRQDAFQYFKKLEKNRIVDLWKVKTFLKNPFVNYDISYPGWNIRQDINQFNCIRIINKNLSSISCSSCDQKKEQLALNDDFQFKKFVFKITNQLILSITKPNQSYSNDEIALDMDYHTNELHLLNQTLLNSFNYVFNELTYDSFFRVFNIFASKEDETEQLILNKYKIQTNEHVEKAFKIFDLLKNVFVSKVNNEYFQYLSDFVLDDLESFQKECKKVLKTFYIEFVITFNRYSFQSTKTFNALNIYYIEFQRYSLELKKELNNNKYYLEFHKAFHEYFLAFRKFSAELQKVLNLELMNKYLEFQNYLEYFSVQLMNKYLEFQNYLEYFSVQLMNKYLELQNYLEYLSIQLMNKYLEFQNYFSIQLMNKYLELQNYLQYFSIQLENKFVELQNYLQYFSVQLENKCVEFQNYLEYFSVQLIKVLNKNEYYLEFIYLIEILSDTLNNVMQDAITQHSSSWIICQKEWLNRSIFRTVKNLNLNAFVLSIQTEYFQKRLESLLSISNNLKDKIEFWITENNYIINDDDIIWNHIFLTDDLDDKSIPNLESSIDKQTIAPLVLNDKKSIIQLIIDAFDNGKNYKELLNNADFSTWLSSIFDDQDNWLNPLKLSNKNSLRTSFYKANTFEFLDYLHCPRFFYKRRLSSYVERIHIKNKNVAYGQLLNLIPIYNNLSIGEMRTVYSEKETISLIKSQVNILLDKYLRDQVLIRDLDKSSNLLNKLNSIIQINFDEDVYQTPLINPQIIPQIVNFDKNSCYPFLSSSDSEEKIFNQYSKNSLNSLIQTQSYQEDLLSEISLQMNKFAEKEEYSSTESFKQDKDFIEDKDIGDFIEVKAIGDFFNKEKLKFFFSKLKFLFSFKTVQINILFEKWGLFQTYSSWLWLLNSAGWKYTKNMFLATFPEIPINSSDQLPSIPHHIRQNWNHNLNILRSLYHQFWALLKWEIQNKIDIILRDKILPILNDKILPILNDEILPILNLMLSRWKITNFLEITNEVILEMELHGKLPILFDGWKDIKNIREYDLFLCIFIGFLFYFSCTISLLLIKFLQNFYLIRVLQNDKNCFKSVGKMMRSFKIVKKQVTNLSRHGLLVTLIDYLDAESDPDDIELGLLWKMWYIKKKWLVVPYFDKYSIHFNRCWQYYSLVEKIRYEFDELYDLLLREKRYFSVQQKILQFESKLTPPIGLFHEFQKQPGLLYFRYLAEFIQRGLTHRIGLMNSKLNSLSLAEMPIFAAFYQKMTSVPIRSFLDDHVKFYPLYPVPSFSNRILLIGPKETGRSYLAKSLAADSYLPLIRISPKSFLGGQKLLSRYQSEHTISTQISYLEHESLQEFFFHEDKNPKRDSLDDKGHYNMKPHKLLNDREENDHMLKKLTQFSFALKLAKLMSPCVIWIPSIHELNNHLFLLVLLEELLGDSYSDDEKETTIEQNIVVIASTDIPKKIDPLLISPPRSKRRFDTFINTKNLPAPYRGKEFPVLLRNKGLYLKKEWNCYDEFEFGLTTKGFTMKDLAKLADEILLVSMSQNTSAIDNDIIGVTLYRSNWGPCNYNLKFSEFFQGLPYKIGKAVIQNKLTYFKNSIALSLDFQDRRANYLHQWYLEPSIAGTVAKEFTVFYHILGCLAGSVAQDCCFLSESNKENWNRPFDPFIENDFILASSLLQGILEEFPSLSIYQGNSNYITIAPQFKTDTMQKGLSSILDKIVLSKELINSYVEEEETTIVWSSRTWRFSFIRSNRFQHIKDITIENPLLDYLHLFGSFQKRPTRLSSLYSKKFLMSGSDFQSIYNKTDDIRQRKTAALWEAKLLYKKFQRMGIYQFNTEEYAMEYKPLNTPVICIARRFLWDPVSIRFLNKHLSFEPTELFVSKELVKSIYLTYSSTRELPFSIKKTLKAIRKRKKVRKMALGIKIQTNDDNLSLNSKMKEKESFEDFKRFQEIGIRLRRVLPYYQSLIGESWFREKTRDDKFKKRLLKRERDNIDLLYNESLIYNTLFESYEYLSNLFFSNRILLKQMIDTLLKTKWLSPNAIDCLLAEGFNKKT